MRSPSPEELRGTLGRLSNDELEAVMNSPDYASTARDVARALLEERASTVNVSTPFGTSMPEHVRYSSFTSVASIVGGIFLLAISGALVVVSLLDGYLWPG